ncbi:MAG: sulfotransferase [Proteobacteria bacterium]|nr:sulfotransferase [Pseudomonadota bacterium]
MNRAERRRRKKLASHEGGARSAAAASDGRGRGEAGYHIELGGTLRENGKLDDAIVSYRRALELDPDSSFARLQSARLKTHHSPDDDDIKALEALYARPDISSEQRVQAAFGLGKAFEDLKNYDQAFEYFAAGNRLRYRGYDQSVEDRETGIRKLARAVGLTPAKSTPEQARREANFKFTKSAFDASLFERFAGAGCMDETPIFVVGMPRSGTSLIEQILASHSQVFGAGEISEMADIGGSFLNRFARAGERLDGCDPAEFERVGRDYVRALKKHANSSRFITDKMPENFIFIGLIKLALPNAKIIHCRRDARDTCTSIFRQLFATDRLDYAYDLGALGRSYNLYSDLMAHWQDMLPGAIYDISYENLVSDQTVQTRALLEHCGLAWEESCLRFYETNRPIKTRAEQVRKPISDASVGSWKRYEKQLAPLLKVLH